MQTYYSLPTLIDAYAYFAYGKYSQCASLYYICYSYVRFMRLNACMWCGECVMRVSMYLLFRHSFALRLHLTLSLTHTYIYIHTYIDGLSYIKRENVFIPLLCSGSNPLIICRTHTVHCVEAMTPPTIHISIVHIHNRHVYTHIY